MSTSLRFSVIVPTFNRADLLRRCLDALAQQDYAGPYEVIVVDDGSTDRTPGVLRSRPGVIHLRQANRGPAAARNRGIAAATGDILAFTDDDCLVPADWLSRLADGYVRHPAVAGVGGYLEAPTEVLEHNLLARFERSVGRDEYGAGPREVLGGFDCPAGGTNNMSYRRAVLEEVGGFDEAFPFAAGEDADLKRRITDRGYQLLYTPVKVTHLQPYTWDAFRRQHLTRGRGVVHFERKHAGRPPTLTRALLRLGKRLGLLPVELIRGPDRRLALVRFAARGYDGVGQLREIRRLRQDER